MLPSSGLGTTIHAVAANALRKQIDHCIEGGHLRVSGSSVGMSCSLRNLVSASALSHGVTKLLGLSVTNSIRATVEWGVITWRAATAFLYKPALFSSSTGSLVVWLLSVRWLCPNMGINLVTGVMKLVQNRQHVCLFVSLCLSVSLSLSLCLFMPQSLRARTGWDIAVSRTAKWPCWQIV
ncbi:unnamed protein product [Symbiodinium natans]|uniref:Uncharacterized protein n=1 Tax=Symbiodinium natans TaxID=878477 RepID=A0A812IB51_9DINO|nr:unnamed protein product [Symbiodinium natans]